MRGALRMRALVKRNGERGLTFAEVPQPSIGPRDVLIRVDMAGVCGTDLHIYQWDAWAAGRVHLGSVVGHEFMGRVVQLGAAVESVAVGDRVSGEGHIGCGRCYCCRTGEGHICESVDIIGIDRDGCFADYVSLPEQNVWRLHDSISDRLGAIHDPLGNAMHTVMVDDVSGKSVLVVGAGAIGLLIVNIARAAGALDVVAVEPNRKKRELAKEMGAEAVWDPADSAGEERLLARTRGGRGFDVVLDASGSPQGIHTGLRLLRSGGWAALIGIPKTDVSLNLAEDVVFKGITIHGINGRKMFETWYQVEDFLVHNRLRVEPVITHVIPFSRFEEAFALLEKGEAIKVILDLAAERKDEVM